MNLTRFDNFCHLHLTLVQNHKNLTLPNSLTPSSN
jgi:hypothetical protein